MTTSCRPTRLLRVLVFAIPLIAAASVASSADAYRGQPPVRNPSYESQLIQYLRWQSGTAEAQQLEQLFQQTSRSKRVADLFSRAGRIAGTFPKLRALNQVSLAYIAFELGWKIGRTIDTRWLHLSGDIGTTTAGGATVTSAKWVFKYKINCGTPTLGQCFSNGWQLETSAGGGFVNYFDPADGALWTHASSLAVGSWLPILDQYCGRPSCHQRWLTETEMEQIVTIERNERYTGVDQRVDRTSTWTIPSILDVDGARNWLTWPSNSSMTPEEDQDVNDWFENRVGGGTPNPLPDRWRVPDCWKLTVAACETKIATAAGAAGYAVPSISTAVLPEELIDPFAPPGTVVTTSPERLSLGEWTSVALDVNPDPLPSSGGGGSGDWDQGSPTDGGGGKCSFPQEGPTWEQLEQENPTYYQEQCQQAWATFWSKTGEPQGSIPAWMVEDAKVITQGLKIGNPAVRERLAQYGWPIEEWAKCATEWYQQASGHHFRVHFYCHKATGTVDLLYDFKVRFRYLF